MRNYEDIASRVRGLGSSENSIETLREVEGYPVFCITISRDLSLPTVFVNGGTHGDEPAGVEGALAFMEGIQLRWLDRLQLSVIPCLNPYGYVHNSRENAQGVDVNWAYLKNDVPEVDLLRGFVHGRQFQAVVDLHEDWESPGFYFYEMFRGRQPIGKRIANRVSKVCPLNESKEIEGELANDGVIHPNMKVDKRRSGEGIPIALFQEGYTDYLVTLETPTGQGMDTRIRAHLVAIETIIEEHWIDETTGTMAAREKPEYQIALSDVVEPVLSLQDWIDLKRGIRLFNKGEFWESHEAWELVWKRHLEPSRIFFQGLIQLAAAFHQLNRGIFHGFIKHLNNSDMKLRQFPGSFLGFEVEGLIASIFEGRKLASSLGAVNLDKFDSKLIPLIKFEVPGDSDPG